MPIHSKLPARQIPAKRALNIIKKASGISADSIKKNLRQFNTLEIKKISHNAKKNFITQQEMKTLLKKAEKAGIKLNSTKINNAYNKINREEKKRKIQYRKEREQMTENLTAVKQNKLDYTARDATGNIRANLRMKNLAKKTGQLQIKNDSLGWDSSPKNSWSDNKKKDDKDNKNDKPTMVIELPI